MPPRESTFSFALSTEVSTDVAAWLPPQEHRDRSRDRKNGAQELEADELWDRQFVLTPPRLGSSLYQACFLHRGSGGTSS